MRANRFDELAGVGHEPTLIDIIDPDYRGLPPSHYVLINAVMSLINEGYGSEDADRRNTCGLAEVSDARHLPQR